MSHLRKLVIPITLLFLFFAPAFSEGFAFELSPAAQSEIAHLLNYIEKSRCRFCRNGTWYNDTKAVRGHVDTKYHYFMDKGQIGSTEDFINRAATKSEMTGKPYLVKCNNGAEMPLSEWLTHELVRSRKEQPSSGARQGQSGKRGSVKEFIALE